MFVLFQRAEEKAHAFLHKELKMSGEEEVDGKNEEQRGRAIEGVVDITKLCLMEMNQKELADPIGGP